MLCKNSNFLRIQISLLEIPNIAKLLAIKGIGIMTVAGFIAEVGDIGRFEHPKQIQKLAGLNLKEDSSGKQKGKTTLSRQSPRMAIHSLAGMMQKDSGQRLKKMRS